MPVHNCNWISISLLLHIRVLKVHSTILSVAMDSLGKLRT